MTKIKATTLIQYLNNFNYGSYTPENLQEFIDDVKKVKDLELKDTYGNSLMGTLNIEILKTVHAMGGDVNSETNSKGMIMTVLSQALYWGQTDVVKYLLENGADTFKKSEYNECAWDYAMSTISCSQDDNIDCLNLLMKHSPINLNDYKYLRDENSKPYDLFELSTNSGNFNSALWLVENGFKLLPKHKECIQDELLCDWEEEQKEAHKKILAMAQAL